MLRWHNRAHSILEEQGNRRPVSMVILDILTDQGRTEHILSWSYMDSKGNGHYK